MFKENDFVKHTRFGIGKVLELYGTKKDPRAKIFFIGGNGIDKIDTGEKSIVPTIPSLSILDNDEINKLQASADYILFENLSSENDNSTYKNINEAILGFKKELKTNDFDGEFYLKDERDYKIFFHQNAKKLLDKKLIDNLLQDKNYEQLLKNLKDVFSSYYEGSSQNLTHYLEPLKLIDALNEDAKVESFFIALNDVLYGNEDFEDRFRNWVDLLSSLGHAKWTMTTILLFIVHPDKYMYVKPKTTQNALLITGFFAQYDSYPNYKFYKTVLDCSQYIFEKTKQAGLNPKDMIDVQSFMWCIRPEYDNHDRAYEDTKE